MTARAKGAQNEWGSLLKSVRGFVLHYVGHVPLTQYFLGAGLEIKPSCVI